MTSNLDSLPQILAAYQKYGPEFSKIMTQNYISAQQRNPEAFPELYSILQPLVDTVKTRLGKANSFSQSGNPSDIPNFILNPYRQSLRDAQANRGMAESPVSAYAEANYLLPYTENYTHDVIGEGQSLAGLLNTTRSIGDVGAVGLDDLGLKLPDIGSSMDLEGQTLQPFRESAKQDNYTATLAYRQAKAKQKSGTASMIGGGIGAVAGPFVGLDPYTGAQLGSAAGKTFF